MYIQQAIEKAIMGGYMEVDGMPAIMGNGVIAKFSGGVRDVNNEIFLDPLFWQALGKSLGWEALGRTEMILDDFANVKTVDWWRWKMHRFIDWISEGKDPGLFFNQLLTQ